MLITSVILVLQETLEAALLISVLLAISCQQRRALTWFPVSLLCGALLAFLYAANMGTISEWFDYVGQEIVNALLQVSIALLIIIFTWSLLNKRNNSPNESKHDKPFSLLFFICVTLSVAFAITREGAEVLTYLGGFFQQSYNLQTVLVGSTIGFTIGLSIGTLLFYILRGLPAPWSQRCSLFLLALFAGNMLSQSALQLTQADWLPAAQAVWDTSGWVSEGSIAGQLLYALIGYEATPSLFQVVSYLLGTGLVLMPIAIRSKFSNHVVNANIPQQ